MHAPVPSNPSGLLEFLLFTLPPRIRVVAVLNCVVGLISYMVYRLAFDSRQSYNTGRDTHCAKRSLGGPHITAVIE